MGQNVDLAGQSNGSGVVDDVDRRRGNILVFVATFTKDIFSFIIIMHVSLCLNTNIRLSEGRREMQLYIREHEI